MAISVASGWVAGGSHSRTQAGSFTLGSTSALARPPTHGAHSSDCSTGCASTDDKPASREGVNAGHTWGVLEQRSFRLFGGVIELLFWVGGVIGIAMFVVAWIVVLLSLSGWYRAAGSRGLGARSRSPPQRRCGLLASSSAGSTE